MYVLSAASLTRLFTNRMKKVLVLNSLTNVRKCSTTAAPTLSLRNYEELPSVPGGLPFLGSFMKLGAKPYGWEKHTENLQLLREKHDPEDYGLLRMTSRLFNPTGEGRILAFFDPKDVEIAYKHEGKYPNRGSGFAPLLKWRQSRPDMFEETTGVLMEEGEQWHHVRSLVQQDLMRPKSAMFYLDQIQDIGHDFVDFLDRKMSASEDGKTIRDLLPQLYNYGFEGSAAIALNRRMGVFRENPDPEVLQQLQEVRYVIEMLPELIMGIPWYRIIPWMSPKYQKFVGHIDNFAYFVKAQIDEVKVQIKEKVEKNQLQKSDDISVLEKLILKNGLTSNIPFVMALDMIAAGIDTTGASSGFLLYHLAANPEKQEILRKELLEHDPHITESSLKKMRYLKACIKESARLTPIITFHLRLMQEDFSVKGFKIPAGTMGMWSTILTGRDPKYVDNPTEFQPERWLRGNESRIGPFISLPFGHGPRMCVGKRFADIEMQLLTAKLIRTYRWEWIGEQTISTKWQFINVPDKSLDFKLHRLNSD
ncbi:probable cytochrome P450 49a1 [Tigriopus californicus]|nr:probable cytochrome P450 49a1 [Tigriopus californicus]